MRTVVQSLTLVLLIAAAWAGGIRDVAAAEAKPLNVVLILADDFGWTDLACYGSEL
jgi:hypothetical protein